MESRYRIPVILFLTNYAIIIMGTFFKVQHWPNGSFIVGAGIIVQLISLLWLIIVLNNNYRFPLVLFLVSYFFTGVGTIFKIMHYPGSPFLFAVGMTMQIVAIVWLIVLVFRGKR
jgi:hypothetical protein